MTAAMIIAGTTVTIGAITKISLSAFAGVNSSLKINFTASAMGCNRPCQPARFGPMRTWMRASARRSYKVKYAKPVSNTKIMTKALITNSSQIVQSIATSPQPS